MKLQDNNVTTWEESFELYLEWLKKGEELGRSLKKPKSTVQKTIAEATQDIKEREATNVLEKVGIDPYTAGYKYWKRAIILCIEDESYISDLKKLYNVIATEYGIKADSVLKYMIKARNIAIENSNKYLYKWTIGVIGPNGSFSHSKFLKILIEDIKDNYEAEGELKEDSTTWNASKYYFRAKESVQELGKIFQKNIPDAKRRILDSSLELKEYEAQKILGEIGISPYEEAYKYWKYAIILCIEDESYLTDLERLYTTIGIKYEEKARVVSKSMMNIRNIVIENKNGKITKWLPEIIGKKGNFSNSKFLSKLIKTIKDSY